MNIYLISQNINNYYNTFDSAVVIAANELDARHINPSGDEEFSDYCWVEKEDINKIKVILIGKAIRGSKRGVVCASFNKLEKWNDNILNTRLKEKEK